MTGWDFWRTRPGLATLIGLEFLTLLMVSYQIQVSPRMSLLERMCLTVIAPFQHISHTSVEFVRSRMQKIRSIRDLQEENERLRLKAQRMDATLVDLEEERQENARLRALLKIEERPSWQYVYAEVVGQASLREDPMLIINKGSRHGLRRDLGVICDQGVVGIIWETSPWYAKVMLVSNPGSAIAAMIQDSRYHDAYMTGGDDARGQLENVPNFQAVSIGDRVLTSGMDGLFPKGLALGTVIRTQPSSGMFQSIEVHYASPLHRLEEVSILIPRPQTEEP